MLKANIYVTLKNGVLDPQGEAVKSLLRFWILDRSIRCASANLLKYG